MSRLVPFQGGTEYAPYYPIPTYILDADISQTAILVYGFMLSRAIGSRDNENQEYTDDYGVFIYASVKEMAKIVHKGKTAIQDALNLLQEKGFIKKKRRGLNRTNKYYVMILDDRKSDYPNNRKFHYPNNRKVAVLDDQKSGIPEV